VTARRRVDDYPFFDNGGRPIGFAHRGGARMADLVGLENTMVAFEAAVRLGFRYVETDVNATADGVLLAFHDRTLERSCDLAGVVAELPYTTVQRARLGGREPIPQLSEVLTTWPELRLNIDCKAPQAIRPLIRTLEAHRAWDRVCLASFSVRSLSMLRHRLGPRVATSYGKPGVAALRFLPGRALRIAALGPGGLAAQVPPSYGPLTLVTPAVVERAHDLGKHLHVWTVDDADEMGRLLDLGVDGIFTDRPDVLRDVYRSRGQWYD
jgi:glycerophosphoryl diester phosphodiesterase